MWGSTRIKDTTFKATKGFVDILAKRCDGSHQHESWRPSLGKAGVLSLCKAYAACVWHALREDGLRAPGQGFQRARDIRAFSVKRVPPLLGEFWLICPESTKNLGNATSSCSAGANGKSEGTDRVGKQVCSLPLTKKAFPHSYTGLVIHCLSHSHSDASLCQVHAVRVAVSSSTYHSEPTRATLHVTNSSIQTTGVAVRSEATC